MRQLFLVSEQRGGPWDWSKGLREQSGFGEHAAFMDTLVDDGFIVLGGPLDEHEVLLAVEADSVGEITERLISDPWIISGALTVMSVRPWTILLESQVS